MNLAGNVMWELWLVFGTIAQPRQITDISSSTRSFLPHFIGGTEGLKIYKDSGAFMESKIEFFKCSLSGTCSWGLLEGVFRTLSIRFARMGCDIKLNRLLTGR